jgi:predicted amidohydrolase YtcJ
VTLNPWEGIQAGVTRQTREGKPEAGFVPEQRLTVEETVRGYTIGAAYAGRREKTEGSIEPGKLADLIILSQNIFDIDPHRIAETKVLTTIVGGRVVYQAAVR